MLTIGCDSRAIVDETGCWGARFSGQRCICIFGDENDAYASSRDIP